MSADRIGRRNLIFGNQRAFAEISGCRLRPAIFTDQQCGDVWFSRATPPHARRRRLFPSIIL